jgi:TetR/AcrR family transcriptional repressor of nem operon
MAREDIRNELIESGLKLFARSGYTATGVKDLVEASHVPKGSFYYYFDSKEAYAEEVVRQLSVRNAAARNRLLSDRSIPPLARLREYFRRSIETYASRGFCEGCLIGNLTLEVSDSSDLVRAGLQEALSTWQQGIEDVLAEAAAQGQLPARLDPAETAAFLLNSWQGALLRMKAEKNARPMELFLEMVFDRLFA